VSSAVSTRAKRQFRKLLPTEDAPSTPCNILVTELCEAGTLRECIDQGKLLLKKASSGEAPAVDMAAAVELLLDVASALAYLHSMRVVHGDVKSANIFLKHDSTRACGLTAKLGDFSSCRILDEEGHALGLMAALAGPCEDAPAGVTLARCYSVSELIIPADDVYAFGEFDVGAAESLRVKTTGI